jgi:hypothetical protein
MKRHGKAVRFVADPLDQEQRRIVCRERDRFFTIAREQQFLPLRNPDRY